MTPAVSINDMNSKENEHLPYVSYTFEYGSSYDSQPESLLAMEQSLSIENSRQSISSQITPIDEEEYQYYRSISQSNTPDLTKSNILTRLLLMFKYSILLVYFSLI